MQESLANLSEDKVTLDQSSLIVRFSAEVERPDFVSSKEIIERDSQSTKLFVLLCNLIKIQDSSDIPDMFRLLSTKARKIDPSLFANRQYDANLAEIESRFVNKAWETKYSVRRIGEQVLREGMYEFAFILDDQSQSDADKMFGYLDELPNSEELDTIDLNETPHHFVLRLPVDSVRSDAIKKLSRRNTAFDRLQREGVGRKGLRPGIGLSVAKGYGYHNWRNTISKKFDKEGNPVIE